MEDYDSIIRRALLMVGSAARERDPTRWERALRNAKSMIDKAAQRRYTGGVTETGPPGDPPPQPNRAASSRPPASAIITGRRAKRNESR